MIAGTPVEKEADVRTWQEDESPYELLIQTLKGRGIRSGKIGIEETVKFVFADGIAHAGAPAFQVVSATPVTAGCRMIKDAHEIECLRIAGQATIRVYEAVYKALAEGMTQRDVSGLVQAAYARVGFPGNASLNIGEYTASPHGSRTPQTIREGTILMLDDGCRVEGYTVTVLRRTFTAVLGKPTRTRLNEGFRGCASGHRRRRSRRRNRASPTTRWMRLRARLSSTRATARGSSTSPIASAMGSAWKCMSGATWSRTICMDGQPGASDSTVRHGIRPKPRVYIRGEFGVRLEDDLHVTENGAELLTAPSPSLEHPFG